MSVEELLAVVVVLLCLVLVLGATTFACLFYSGVVSDCEDKDF